MNFIAVISVHTAQDGYRLTDLGEFWNSFVHSGAAPYVGSFALFLLVFGVLSVFSKDSKKR